MLAPRLLCADILRRRISSCRSAESTQAPEIDRFAKSASDGERMGRFFCLARALPGLGRASALIVSLLKSSRVGTLLSTCVYARFREFTRGFRLAHAHTHTHLTYHFFNSRSYLAHVGRGAPCLPSRDTRNGKGLTLLY